MGGYGRNAWHTARFCGLLLRPRGYRPLTLGVFSFARTDMQTAFLEERLKESGAELRTHAGTVLAWADSVSIGAPATIVYRLIG